MYLWERLRWPSLTWDERSLSTLLAAVSRQQGRLLGRMETLGSVLMKARFWERFATEPLNERQITILNNVLDGIEGKLTTSKWAKIARCSQDTAYRDILDLVRRGALQKDTGGGRSTSYSLALDKPASG